MATQDIIVDGWALTMLSRWEYLCIYIHMYMYMYTYACTFVYIYTYMCIYIHILTMLSRENVGYASVCNSIGQSFGFFLANQGTFFLIHFFFCTMFIHDSILKINKHFILFFYHYHNIYRIYSLVRC
jgi:hypothetical protein